jgi:hypothetical protein
MTNKLLCLILVIFLLANYSCSQKNNSEHSNNTLSVADSLEVVRGVFNATEEFANGNNTLDAEKVSEFWLQSPDFILVENTTLINGFDAVYKNCQNFYAVPIDSTKLIWTERNILPLTKNLAHLYGRYDMYIRFKSGEVIHAVPFYSALLKLESGWWKVIRSHESYELNDN